MSSIKREGGGGEEEYWVKQHKRVMRKEIKRGKSTCQRFLRSKRGRNWKRKGEIGVLDLIKSWFEM